MNKRPPRAPWRTEKGRLCRLRSSPAGCSSTRCGHAFMPAAWPPRTAMRYARCTGPDAGRAPLASMEFLRASGQTIELASYDRLLIDAARSLRFGVLALR